MFQENQPNNKEPLFNPALDYLKVLSELRRRFHESIYLENYVGAYNLLVGIYFEAYPRLKPDQVKELDIKKNKCEAMINNQISLTKNIGGKIMLRNTLQDWFKDLNLYMHKQGLGMPDKPSFEGALRV